MSQEVMMSWARDDIEQRLGVTGGRFTSPSSGLCAVAAMLATVGFYAVLLPLRETYFAQMFTERGLVQYVIVFFSCWCVAMLLVKVQKLRVQRRALSVRLLPPDPDFVLSSATAGQVITQLHDICDEPRRFMLFNRIELALSNLRNMGRIGDFEEVLRSQAQNDEDVSESSYSLLRGLIWAIPVLGFIGTVQGLSAAVGNFGAVLGATEEVSALKPALRGVTAGLAVAFETTLVALVAALVIQLLLTLVRRSEEHLLDDLKEYCQRRVVSRLRITPLEAMA